MWCAAGGRDAAVGTIAAADGARCGNGIGGGIDIGGADCGANDDDDNGGGGGGAWTVMLELELQLVEGTFT